MTETKIQDIGGVLRQRREQLGYSLQDAAEQTRIRQVLLESIEDNRFSELPGQAYVTGFIRVYAGFLGLDSDSLLAQLEENLPIGTGTAAVKHIPVAKHKPGRSRKTAAKQGSSSLLWGLLAILLVGAAIYYLPGVLQEEPPVAPSTEQTATPKEAVPQPAEPVASSLRQEAGQAVETADQAGDGPRVEGGAASESSSLPAPAPAQVEDSSAAKPGEQADRPVEAPSREVEPAPLQESNQYPPIAPGGSSLRMLAVAESSLVIYLEGRTPHNYKLHDGLDLTWKIKRQVRVEMAKPGAARFWLDGKELKLGQQPGFQLQAAPGG
jgi:cytoskeletal protein RodZ